MKVSQVGRFSPFNAYDFYGYLFPGAILVLFSICNFIWFTPVSLRSIIEVLSEVERLRVVLGVIVGSGFIAMVYFAGHVNGTLSHLLYDRFMLKRVLGYPILALLGVVPENSSYRRAVHLYLILVLNAILIWPVVMLLIPDNSNYLWMNLVLWALFFLLGGAAVFRSVFVHGERVVNTFAFRSFLGKQKLFIRPIRVMAKVLHYIATFLFFLCRKHIIPFMDYLLNRDRVSEEVVAGFRKNIRKLAETGVENLGRDNFWIPYIHICRNEPVFENMLSNWMNLYAFLKNLSVVAFILCAELSVIATIHVMGVPNIFHVTDPVDINIFFAGFAFFYLSGVVLAVRYWVIYRNYFTKFIIRSFSMLDLSCDSEYQNYEEQRTCPETIEMKRKIIKLKDGVSYGSTSY